MVYQVVENEFPGLRTYGMNDTGFMQVKTRNKEADARVSQHFSSSRTFRNFFTLNVFCELVNPFSHHTILLGTILDVSAGLDDQHTDCRRPS
jgi:hypothetical protein